MYTTCAFPNSESVSDLMDNQGTDKGGSKATPLAMMARAAGESGRVDASSSQEQAARGEDAAGMKDLIGRFPELDHIDDLGLEEQVKVYQSALAALQEELHGQD